MPPSKGVSRGPAGQAEVSGAPGGQAYVVAATDRGAPSAPNIVSSSLALEAADELLHRVVLHLDRDAASLVPLDVANLLLRRQRQSGGGGGSVVAVAVAVTGARAGYRRATGSSRQRACL